MRIGIDARIISKDNNKSKVASYTYHLIKNLISHDKENKYVLFFDSRVNNGYIEEFAGDNTEIMYFPFSTYKHYLSYAYSQFIVSGFLAKQRLDVFHACAGTVPLTYLGPTVLNIFELAEKGLNRAAQKKIAKKAKMIITTDDNLRKKIIEAYKVQDDRVIPMDYCGAFEGKNASNECINKYLEIYTVARNSEIKDRYLVKIPLTVISSVAKPLRKIVEPVGRVVIYPVKSISKLKRANKKKTGAK